MRQTLPMAFFLTDDNRVPDPVGVVSTLPKSVAVIFRHYGHPKRAALCADMRRECFKRGIPFLVAGNLDLAADVQADGVHLPAWYVRRVRKRPGYSLVTAAVHDQRELRAADAIGTDAVLISPVFSTASHGGAAPLGIHRFARLAKSATVPVFAMGGVGWSDVRRVHGAGAAGIAGIGLFLKADAPYLDR